MRKSLVLLMTFILTLVYSKFIFAFEPVKEKENQVLAVFDKSFEVKTGDQVQIQGTYLYNELGEKELRIDLLEVHYLYFDTKQLFLIARDLDDDNKIDTWFYLNENGIVKTIEKKLNSDNDYESMHFVLNQIFDNDGRWMIHIAMRFALQNLTFTGEEELEFWSNYESRQIDLIDLGIRLDRLALQFPKDETLFQFKKANAEAWKQLLLDFKKHRGEDRLKMVGADVALFFAGGLFLKGVSFSAKFAMHKLSSSKSVNSFSKFGSEHFNSLNNKLEKSQNLIKTKARSAASPIAKVGGIILTRLSLLPIYARPKLIIGDLVEKSNAAKYLKTSLGFLSEVAKEIYKAKGYILFSESIQISTESIARGYISFSDVPLILDSPLEKTQNIFDKIGSDKELLQNIGYMASETSIVTGVAKVMEQKGHKLGKIFLVSAFISTLNSVIVAKFVKNEVHAKRIAGDTAWEVIVGNSQVLFDHWQWRKWQDLADKTGVKSLKLAGYLLTYVHQASGYFVYSKWAQLLDTAESAEVHSPLKAAQEMHPVLIPVYTP